MKRRTFLAVVAGGAAVGAAATVWRLAAGDTVASLFARLEGLVWSPAARLRRHYAWMSIDPAAIDRYVADYGRVGRVGRFSALTSDFYTRFLLSTNFFAIAGTRSTARTNVVYTRFYDPNDRWCQNPLAGAPPAMPRRGSVG